MGASVSLNSGSFRDPSGHVYEGDGRIFRMVSYAGKSRYEAVRSRNSVAALQEKGLLIGARELPQSEWPETARGQAYILEHPKIPFISYPYEWSFVQLKAAALLHLDLQLALLDDGVVLSDATAYNIQFVGHSPVFIDFLSLRPYVDGEFWWAHRQFCEQFLNPLLLRAVLGVAHNAWFRGGLEGISTSDLARLIPHRRRYSWNMFTQVILQAKYQRDATSDPLVAVDRARKLRKLPKTSYRAILQQLRNWITRLSPADKSKSIWGQYASENTYSGEEAQAKRIFVSEFVNSVAPHTIIDLGCNSGNYTIAALEAGARYAIGFDFDQNVISEAFLRSRSDNLSFLPLWLDASNPSPNQGWRQSERQGFAERARVDGLIALAFEHHLAIAKNTPLDQLLPWMLQIAPQGVIEFVPKSDPTVQRMLALREDIFPDYTEDAFLGEVRKRADVVKTAAISSSGRKMIWFKRRSEVFEREDQSRWTV